MVEATAKGDYFYRLSHEDIIESARLVYKYFPDSKKKANFFSVISSTEQLEMHLEIFQQKK